MKRARCNRIDKKNSLGPGTIDLIRGNRDGPWTVAHRMSACGEAIDRQGHDRSKNLSFRQCITTLFCFFRYYTSSLRIIGRLLISDFSFEFNEFFYRLNLSCIYVDYWSNFSLIYFLRIEELYLWKYTCVSIIRKFLHWEKIKES